MDCIKWRFSLKLLIFCLGAVILHIVLYEFNKCLTSLTLLMLLSWDALAYTCLQLMFCNTVILFVTIRLTTAVTYVATFKFQLLSFVYQVRKFEKENWCQDVTAQYCKEYHYHNTTHLSRASITFRRSFFMSRHFTSAKLELHAFLRTRTIPYTKKKKQLTWKKEVWSITKCTFITLRYFKIINYVVFVKYTRNSCYGDEIFHQIDICGNFRPVRHQRPLLQRSLCRAGGCRPRCVGWLREVRFGNVAWN